MKIDRKQQSPAIRLNPDKNTMDQGQVRLGGAKKPFKIKLATPRRSLDKKQVRLGGAKAPLKR